MNDNEELESLKEIEDQWRLRVIEAQAKYQHAFDQHRRMAEELNRVLIEPSNGHFAISKAKKSMALALNEVLRTQKTLIDLVLRKKMPSTEEDEWLLL